MAHPSKTNPVDIDSRTDDGLSGDGLSGDGQPTSAKYRRVFNPTGLGVPETFPFRTVFSLGPFIERWAQMAEAYPDIYGPAYREIEDRLSRAPELREPIRDTSRLDGHEETLALLVQPVFPNSHWTNELRGVMAPFGKRYLYCTKRLEQALRLKENDYAVPWDDDLYTGILYAYRVILKKFYDEDLPLDQPLIYAAPDPDNDLVRYYKFTATNPFIRVHALKPLPEVSAAMFDTLRQNVDDIGLWMAHIPPDGFEFEGMSTSTLIDITSEVATNALKHILLTSDAGVTEENFDLLQNEVRTLFGNPALQLGLATVRGGGTLNFASNRKIWNSLRIRDAVRAGSIDLSGSFYEKAYTEGLVTAVKDLRDWNGDREIADHLLSLGVRSLMLVPLKFRNDTVGLLELSSPSPGDFQSLATLKRPLVESIFALATHQNRERFEDRVGAIIRSSYTAIHPSVAWRFREAAIAMLDKQKRHEAAVPEEIIFRDVYPVYGSADVRQSSQHRNEAIRADLIEHLEGAQVVLKRAIAIASFDLAEALDRRIEDIIGHADRAWGSGNEAQLAEFIRDEVNPMLDLLKIQHPLLAPNVQRYYDESGGVGGLRARRRRAYESSLGRLNDVIADVLDEEQRALQAVFPHYFEKYKTDGVEYTMFIGASISPDRPFDMAYVKNVRLRQLAMSCQIAQRIATLKGELEVPLDVAQLVLVTSTPLTIRFRADEKKFDVDGTYNVRFEIVKKRIDKARVRGTDQRVTQPGKIAIIYSVDKEAEEYVRYIGFLQDKGSLTSDVEWLELEDLPGATGLKALRVGVGEG